MEARRFIINDFVTYAQGLQGGAGVNGVDSEDAGRVSTASRPEPLGPCDPAAAARSDHENHVLHRLQRSRLFLLGLMNAPGGEAARGGSPARSRSLDAGIRALVGGENTMKMG